jgi:hypothetical protein
VKDTSYHVGLRAGDRKGGLGLPVESG